MAVAEAVEQGGIFLGADVLCLPAARAEAAAGRGIGGRGDVALQQDAPAGAARLGIGDGTADSNAWVYGWVALS